MYRLFVLIIIILSLLGTGIYLLSNRHQSTELKARISVAEAMTNRETEGYARAIAPREFIFPDDYGPHPEFQTEWWYYTGNLTTENGRHFGFQFTIFRNSISPDSKQPSSPWASNQIYMGHFALTDVEGKQFYSFERFSRGAIHLAGAQAVPFRVWLEDWKVEATEVDSNTATPVIRIRAAENDISLNINLKSTKSIVLHGDHGLSQKGPERGNASYYYSFTRLTARGEIQIKDNSFNVQGLGWLDREWSTSALGKDQVGWDWFSLQLHDGSEIMYYQIRKHNGLADEFSSGTLIEKDGSTRTITLQDISLEVLNYWTSPRSGKYPSHWRLSIPKEKLILEIIPYLANQELDVSIRYWEGAVQIKGISDGKSIEGRGYVELTGYANHN